MKRRWVYAICFMMLFIMMAGCQSNANDDGSQGKQESQTPVVEDQPNETEPPAPKVEEKLNPVTLNLFHQGGYFTDSDFQLLIAEPVKRKYPHITVEMTATPKSLQELFSAGEQIDIYATFYGVLSSFKGLNFLGDMTNLAKEHRFDLSRFDSGALQAISVMSDKGELWALPYNRNLNALYYNKDIFDRFGAPEPVDGMTWDETIDLARGLTREADGVQYRGLEPQSVELLLFQRSLAYVNARNNIALEEMDTYKEVFELGNKIYSVTGSDIIATSNPNARFSVDKTVAMYAGVNMFTRYVPNEELNWDVVQFPSFPDAPNIGSMYDLHVLAPNMNSKSLDDMMRVFEVFYSDEVQTDMVRKTARVSLLEDVKYEQQFGADIPGFQDKNVMSVFKTKPAPAPAFSEYAFPAGPIVDKKFKEYVQGMTDVNTALRETKEEIEKRIAEDLN